jgi:hypothetical protein
LVADFRNHCVIRFSTAGRDAKGRIVAGSEGQCLETVDPLKDIDKPLGPPEGEGRLLKRPVDVEYGRDGSGLLVLDTETCRVQRFESSSKLAQVVAPIPEKEGMPLKSTCNTPEGLKYPRSFISCEDGSLIICDTWSHRVLRFAPPGTPESREKPVVIAGIPNSSGKRPEQLAFPSGIALAPDGSLLVADMNNHRVQRFPPGSGSGTEGETIAGASNCEPGNDLGSLNMPTGICIDPHDGSMLVADRMNSRLLRFPSGSRAGESPEVLVGPSELDRPWGVCVGSDGSIYVSDERRAVVLRLHPRAGQAELGEEEEDETGGDEVAASTMAPETAPMVADAAIQQPVVAAQRPTVSDDCMALD